jgi:NADH-quinone oxidoreductase subunit C
LTDRSESRKIRKEKPSEKVEHILAAASERVHPIEKKLISSSKGLIRTKPEEIREAASIIKSNLDGVIGETVVGVDLQNKQFELIYFFWSLIDKVMIDVRTRVEGDNPAIDSICDIFPGLNWHEREVHEMFGVTFKGHPNMNLLILPDELEGAYPLRKSFQVSRERVKESGIFTPIAKAAKPTQVSTETKTADEGGQTSRTK